MSASLPCSRRLVRFGLEEVQPVVYSSEHDEYGGAHEAEVCPPVRAELVKPGKDLVRRLRRIQLHLAEEAEHRLCVPTFRMTPSVGEGTFEGRDLLGSMAAPTGDPPARKVGVVQPVVVSEFLKLGEGLVDERVEAIDCASRRYDRLPRLHVDVDGELCCAVVGCTGTLEAGLGERSVRVDLTGECDGLVAVKLKRSINLARGHERQGAFRQSGGGRVVLARQCALGRRCESLSSRVRQRRIHRSS